MGTGSDRERVSRRQPSAPVGGRWQGRDSGVRVLAAIVLLGFAAFAPAGGISPATAAANDQPSLAQVVEFDGIVELTFDDGVVQRQTATTNVSSGGGDQLDENNVTVYVDGTAYGADGDFDLHYASGTADGNETVTVSLVPRDTWADLGQHQLVTVHLDAVQADVPGGPVARPGNVTVRTTSAVLQAGGANGTVRDARHVVRGEVLALRGAQNAAYSVRRVGGSVHTVGDFGNSTVVALETSALGSPGTYRIALDGGGDQYINLTEPTATLERNADLDWDGTDEAIRVRPAADQRIAGTTTAPPGTELEVRVTGTDTGSPFVKPLAATVEPDGTFVANGTFTNVGAGANFTVDVRLNGTSILPEPVHGRLDSSSRASLTFNDQESSGGSVVVQSVTTSDGGFVAIRPNVTGPALGRSGYLDAGSTSDVEITLDRRLTEDATLVAMAHEDTDGDQTYEFTPGSATDAPYDENGSAVTDPAQITYRSQPAVSLSDQPLDGGAVTISSLTVPHGGFVALHRGDRRGSVVGTSDVLSPGPHTNVTVETTASLDDGDRIVAVLHRDTDGDGRYEYDLPRPRNVSAPLPGEPGQIRNVSGSASTVALVADHEAALNGAGTFESRLNRRYWSDTEDRSSMVNETTVYALDIFGDRNLRRSFSGSPDEGTVERRYQERQVLYSWWTVYGSQTYEVKTNASLDAGYERVDASAAAGLDTLPADANFTYTGRTTHDGRSVRRYVADGRDVVSTDAVYHPNPTDGSAELYVDDRGLVRWYRVSLASWPAWTRQERTTWTFDLDRVGEPFPTPDWLGTAREQAAANCSGSTVVDAGYRHRCVMVTDAATISTQTPPVATDDRYTTTANASLAVDAPGVLANDSDPDGDELSVVPSPVAGPQIGTLALRPNGSFEYVPGPNVTGTDSFRYRTRDGEGGSDTATVVIDLSGEGDDGDDDGDDGGDGDDETDDGGDEDDEGDDGDDADGEPDDGDDDTGAGGDDSGSSGFGSSANDVDVEVPGQSPSPTPSPTASPESTDSPVSTASPSPTERRAEPSGIDGPPASETGAPSRQPGDQVAEVGGFGGGIAVLGGLIAVFGILGAAWLWRR